MSILEEAAKAAGGDRAKDYGHPSENLGNIAAMFRPWYQRRYGQELPFDALDVAALNLMTKLSRLANTPSHHDSLVDICGYARCWEMILERPPGSAPAE